MVDLVYSARIYGYYAQQIAAELQLQDGETKTFPMNVTFSNQYVEGKTVIYYTLKSVMQEKKVESADPDCNEAIIEAAAVTQTIAEATMQEAAAAYKKLEGEQP